MFILVVCVPSASPPPQQNKHCIAAPNRPTSSRGSSSHPPERSPVLSRLRRGPNRAPAHRRRLVRQRGSFAVVSVGIGIGRVCGGSRRRRRHVLVSAHRYGDRRLGRQYGRCTPGDAYGNVRRLVRIDKESTEFLPPFLRRRCRIVPTVEEGCLEESRVHVRAEVSMAGGAAEHEGGYDGKGGERGGTDRLLQRHHGAQQYLSGDGGRDEHVSQEGPSHPSRIKFGTVHEDAIPSPQRGAVQEVAQRARRDDGGCRGEGDDAHEHGAGIDVNSVRYGTPRPTSHDASTEAVQSQFLEDEIVHLEHVLEG
mmetsp:Transcript_53621/g.160517  ORF Transcript_53621/g.160517 Transcript_53621/m.160517 type:complete len:309 (+) Transcript_53621:218-1144(+)